MAGRFNNVRDFFMVTDKGVDWILETADEQSAPSISAFRLFDFLAFGVGREVFENRRPFNLTLVKHNLVNGPNDDASLEKMISEALNRGFVARL
ncbi:hypothetical protein LCGC14_0421940 [marine sediment metagenome]|uniref:Uncharacterized protein n=1 Tax=marine sediment metagenome TaxID=412755 RepID=A0A0F9SWN6_9ZZZZ